MEYCPCPIRSGSKDWFFLGTPGYGAPFHIDEVKHPSWQAQIRGVKTWDDGHSQHVQNVSLSWCTFYEKEKRSRMFLPFHVR